MNVKRIGLVLRVLLVGTLACLGCEDPPAPQTDSGPPEQPLSPELGRDLLLAHQFEDVRVGTQAYLST